MPSGQQEFRHQEMELTPTREGICQSYSLSVEAPGRNLVRTSGNQVPKMCKKFSRAWERAFIAWRDTSRPLVFCVWETRARAKPQAHNCCFIQVMLHCQKQSTTNHNAQSCARSEMAVQIICRTTNGSPAQFSFLSDEENSGKRDIMRPPGSPGGMVAPRPLWNFAAIYLAPFV
jgi:hypothetical protein